MATRPCPASVVVLEPAQATPVLERPAAARPTRASGGIEIAPLRGSQGRREAPSTRPSGSRSPSAPRGRVTTKTSSPGFVRFQIRTARAPRPRLGQNPRTLPQAWLVVRVVKSQRIGGRPRQHLVRHLGSIHSDAITELGARRRFWAGADARLAAFRPDIRSRFERAIEARIPRPTDDEEAALRARHLAAARARLAARRPAAAPMLSEPAAIRPPEP
jgi:hypothetical protein